MITSFFLFIGFEAISSLNMWGNYGNIIENLGINAHYKSMSKGVIDTRDVLYFLSRLQDRRHSLCFPSRPFR